MGRIGRRRRCDHDMRFDFDAHACGYRGDEQGKPPMNIRGIRATIL